MNKSIMRALPRPFTLPELENTLNRRNAFPYGANPAREADKLLQRWIRQGRVKASAGEGLPRYWIDRGYR